VFEAFLRCFSGVSRFLGVSRCFSGVLNVFLGGV
jgi:hypothetical protein